ncbi:Hypothetical protein PHPALM_36966 [Phytophthora palmivora]|uniref:PX domain-containing protein n=1 Tax=Phytophthora palmivora TaxID=4796 RepID=A0A2P4WYK3_9STRA|nr:Hypothetical protein PHPALM_36966 [Phytophthora palmivora]
MLSRETCPSASTSVLTPSQAAVVALHTVSPTPSTPSPKSRSRSGSFVPLQRFECVRVAKKLRRNGQRVYVASVFLQRSEARRRLSECVYKASPVAKLSPEAIHSVMIAEREPDFVVEHRFSEFRQLRDSIVTLVRTNRAHVKSCAECQDLLELVLSPKHQNWTMKRMFSTKEQRFAMLTTFVNDLLTLTANINGHGNVVEEMVGDKDCRVRESVSTMLQEFLKREYKASLGII